MNLVNEITIEEIEKLILHPDIRIPQSEDERFRNSEIKFYTVPLASDNEAMDYAHRISQRSIELIADLNIPA